MNVFPSFWSRFAAVACLVAAALLVSSCQSPRIPVAAQAGKGAPAATAPAATARAPRQVRPGVPLRTPRRAPAARPGTPATPPYLGRPLPEGYAAPGEAPMAPPPAAHAAVRVALLLPLSGPNRALGQAMLNAAQLAVFDFADSRFELAPHDTRGTPEGAEEAARLAIADGAAIILGPLLATSVRAVAPAARAANVSVVAFSSDRSIAGGGVFTMGFFPEAEVDRVAAYARSRGIVRFALLAPDSEYGAAVAQALRHAAENVGALVTVVQFYDPAATDFSGAVRQLANYDIRRQSLMEQRAALEARQDEIARSALARLKKLETVGGLPFDALLLADGGKRLQAVAALLPFYDVDPSKVRMLGTGQWDVPGLGAEPALLGGWFAAPPPALREDFSNQYVQAYGGKPPRLATLAYDATALAAVLAQGEGGADFSAAVLTAPSGFAGRDGIFRFLPEGIAQRGLAVLKATATGAEVISEAPDTFARLTN